MACSNGPACSGTSYKAGDCSSGCISDCSVCSSACGSSCTSTCVNGCRGGCVGSCSGMCGTVCSTNCQYDCSSTCTANCANSCSDACTATCADDCTNTCKGGCANGCSTTSFNQAYTNLVLNDIILDEDITTIVDWIKREGSLKGVAMASPEVTVGESVPVLYQAFNSIMNNLQAMGKSLSYTPISGNDIKKASVQEYITKAKEIYESLQP